MKKTLILSLLVFLCSGLVMGVPTFQALFPDDDWKTSDTTPKFCAIPTGDDVGGYVNLTLYILETDVGNLSATYNTNITKACITTSMVLNKSQTYSWKFGLVTVSDGVETNSTARTLIVSSLGSAVQTIDELPAVIRPVLFIMVGIFGIIVVLILIAFFSDLFTGIGESIKKGIKGNL